MVKLRAGPGPKSFLIQSKFPQLEELGIAVDDDGSLMICARKIDYSIHGSEETGSVYFRDPDDIHLEVKTGY